MKKQISISKTGKYSQIGKCSKKINNVWIVLHGYGMLSEYFVKKFECIINETTLVIAPISIQLAQTLNLNVDTFLIAVAISASCAFLTPIGHKNNTIILATAHPAKFPNALEKAGINLTNVPKNLQKVLNKREISFKLSPFDNSIFEFIKVNN